MAALVTGTGLSESLTAELAAKGITVPDAPSTKDELESLLKGSEVVSSNGIAALLLSGCSQLQRSVDPIAALTCGAVGVPPELMDDAT